MVWLLAGGICYTTASVFFVMRRLPFSHFIWHLMVLAGSVFHVLAVLHAAHRSTLTGAILRGHEHDRSQRRNPAAPHAAAGLDRQGGGVPPEPARTSACRSASR
jgi:hypothetical protein